ncbi:helix-turn-helix domain-containing protein [Mucilaginibacter agri]|uniref:Helix-turn-helix domain-containing protein n=1 Tax=Mucilaginibacter agri TaxID=2695265 RepID=A0A965ZGI6_9SPHI|nr:AraC family transcriptional regulator [Mucilaginibacter agri]NCD70250.1 helix-turn-helix domain-containing protein [Mucilaginibacter agri]
MINFYERVLQYPNYHRQFNCNDSLITAFNCPAEARLMKTKFAELWTQYNCLFYVVEGKKIWHTADGVYPVEQGSCMFMRKGAFILEQFWDIGFCIVLFFIPDEFICHTLSAKLDMPDRKRLTHKQVIALETNQTLEAFFLSMSSYFGQSKEPDPLLLELKFKELILTIADNPFNKEMLAYFCALIHEPRPVALQRLMDDNFRFNLKLEQFAKLSNRSLSTFKRDFQSTFNTTPGKWLLEKRLLHAKSLIVNSEKSINEIAFESGFETASHFSRAFKQKFGLSPSSVREK